MTVLKIMFFILFFLVAVTTIGQTIKCNYCKKSIAGKYIVVDGIAYHQNHFKCANCNRPIEGAYSSKDGKYYDILQIKIISDNQTEIIYFDITDFFGKH